MEPIPERRGAAMECICGYSAGTKKALDKHIARFAGDAATARLHAPTARSEKVCILKDKYTGIDKNGDRQLDFEEMSGLLLKGDPGMTATELRRLFENVDHNQDGFIDFDEFVDYIYAKGGDQGGGDAPTPPPIQTDVASPLGAGTRSKGVSPKPAASLGSPSCKDSRGSPGVSPKPAASPGSPSCKDSRGSPGGSTSGPPVRLLLVRHAQSANKEKGRLAKGQGGTASKDPELSEKGYEQAEALGVRLAMEYEQAKGHGLIIASSPMRRCLLTIRPALHRLEATKENCRCSGAAYEYGCAGLAYMGSTTQEVNEKFPEFTLDGFSESGQWDYRGSNDKENEEDAKARSWRMVAWIWQVAEVLRQKGSTSSDTIPTLVFSTHQTMADLLCCQLVKGSDADWVYGELTHRMKNTALTELLLKADGTVTFGKRNDDAHLTNICASPARRAKSGLTPSAVTKKIVELRANFAQHDISGDRKLDFNEISTIFRTGNAPISDSDLWELFKEADTDMDGDVDFDEFVEYIFKKPQELQENPLLSW